MSRTATIVFDGECRLCSASAEFVLKHDRHRVFRLTTAQSDHGRAAYLDHDLDPEAMATMLVVIGDRTFTQSDAILAILTTLGWPWRLAATARIVPRPVRDHVYRWIARNRYRWVGKRASCWRPSPEMSDRVI